jgi:hypothetical protein
MKVRARSIDTLVARFPVPPDAAPKPGGNPAEPAPRPGEGSMKYDVEKVRCEGAYVVDRREAPLVHQEPAEPAPDKRGLDIYGQTLLLDHTPNGSVLTVTGADEQRLGQVHHEGTSILGPKVVINQLNNKVTVDGRGSLVLPSNSDLNGGELKQASVVVIHWRDRMEFRGADKFAEFFGQVRAVQNELSVACHDLQVYFDRPVDFSPRKKAAPAPVGPRDPRPLVAAAPAGPPAEKENPKIERVRCYPAPDDARDEPKGARAVTYNEVLRDASGRVVKTQFVEARDLEMFSRPVAPGSKEAIQEVRGQGPGKVRIWQPGEKDAAGPSPMAGGQPAPMGGKPKESEMKLTVVQFAGRMRVVDHAKVYQQATFTETINVIYAPANRPELEIDQYNLPPGSVRMQCADQLVVSQHKKPNEPVVQRMDAVGNAYIRSDQYDGWGETITADGPNITLKGGKGTLAKVDNRYNQTSQNGTELKYNRVTGAFGTVDSTGGSIQGSPAKPKAPPAPPPGRPAAPMR